MNMVDKRNTEDQETSREENAAKIATRTIIAFTNYKFFSSTAIFLKRFHENLVAVGFTDEQATIIAANSPLIYQMIDLSCR